MPQGIVIPKINPRLFYSIVEEEFNILIDEEIMGISAILPVDNTLFRFWYCWEALPLPASDVWSILPDTSTDPYLIYSKVIVDYF